MIDRETVTMNIEMLMDRHKIKYRKVDAKSGSIYYLIDNDETCCLRISDHASRYLLKWNIRTDIKSKMKVKNVTIFPAYQYDACFDQLLTFYRNKHKVKVMGN